ncbi:MAG: SGNH/GDSL hydrolase family protein [Cyclobacteriaceae bacterium]|nr:SGNH/GDSL hydrolase family protein [Cyclobacteriaceae bacterium]MCH8516686.1 SGNH/GDSL hydrolase family protein [Cyclobacteriaceae bacterium]
MTNFPQNIDFLSLGDSYTIGEAVDSTDRWPTVFANRMVQDSIINLKSHTYIATTGWTTNELMTAMDEFAFKDQYGLVSLSIGVNNQFRGLDFAVFEKEFEILLKRAISLAGDRSYAVLVISIPDYGLTPFGQSRNPDKIAKELDRYNVAKKDICEKHGVVFYDITTVSRQENHENSWLASDNLHPGPLQYELWVERFYSKEYRRLMEVL